MQASFFFSLIIPSNLVNLVDIVCAESVRQVEISRQSFPQLEVGGLSFLRQGGKEIRLEADQGTNKVPAAEEGVRNPLAESPALEDPFESKMDQAVAGELSATATAATPGQLVQGDASLLLCGSPDTDDEGLDANVQNRIQKNDTKPVYRTHLRRRSRPTSDFADFVVPVRFLSEVSTDAEESIGSPRSSLDTDSFPKNGVFTPGSSEGPILSGARGPPLPEPTKVGFQSACSPLCPPAGHIESSSSVS